ncbi:hypothetical protein EMCRGX_G013711 [Ephydatia muelleri]
MDQNEFSIVEDYLRMNQYPKGISKGDKANLRRKCKNFKFDCGVLYFRRVKKGEGEEERWKICVRTEDEKRRILESCHAGIEDPPFDEADHVPGAVSALVASCGHESTIAGPSTLCIDAGFEQLNEASSDENDEMDPDEGFVSPTTHSTSNNIPFYVNAIDNTLKMSLANPNIANNLVRYPIISSEYREIYHG